LRAIAVGVQLVDDVVRDAIREQLLRVFHDSDAAWRRTQRRRRARIPAACSSASAGDNRNGEDGGAAIASDQDSTEIFLAFY
jgi:hypothetical protein